MVVLFIKVYLIIIFQKGYVIGDQNYSFEKDTFIFFSNNVRKESFSKFEAAAKTVFGIVQLGVLTNEELKRVIKCALKSKLIVKYIEDELTVFKSTL